MASSAVAANPGPSAASAAPAQLVPLSPTTSSSSSIPPTVPNTTTNGPAIINQYPASLPRPQSPLRFEYGSQMDLLADPKLDPWSDPVCQAHDTVKNLIKQHEKYLIDVKAMCSEVKLKLLMERDTDRFCSFLDQSRVLDEYVKQLEKELSELRWKAISSQSSMSVCEDAVANIVVTVQEGGTTIGTLSAFGAGLALSMLYSANRGNLNYIYAAFWFFLVCMAAVASLSMVGSVKKASDLKATRRNWLSRRVMLLAVVITFVGTIGGFVCLALGAVAFDVSAELKGGEPRIQDGPHPGPDVPRQPLGAIAFVLISVCATVIVVSFISRMRPRVRLLNRGIRETRTKEYLETRQA